MNLTIDHQFDDAFGVGSKALFVGAEQGSGASPISITVPAGTVEGDIAVMAIQTVNSTPNASGPTGGAAWTELYRFDSSSSEYHAIYWKVCGGSEPASWSLTHSSGTDVTVGAAVFRGVNTLFSFAAADDTLTPPVVPGHPQGLQVLVYMTQLSTTLSAPLGAFFNTAIHASPTNSEVLIGYRDTTWVGDAMPIRCGGEDTNFTGAMNMVFAP